MAVDLSRLAFAACNARGFLTITGRDQSEMLYPYSYAHAQGNLSMDFISLAVAYQYSAGRINLSINSGIFINVYSYFNYSYQGQYKTNLFFDGSKEEAADTFSFARADSFAAFDAKLNYSASFQQRQQQFYLFHLPLPKAFPPLRLISGSDPGILTKKQKYLKPLTMSL